MTLSDKIAAAGKMKPWCAGIGSGDATGWPATDWIEDIVLRAVRARRLRPVGQPRRSRSTTRDRPRRWTRSAPILKNPTYVNGGLGDVKTIATTTFQDGGLPILDGQVRACTGRRLLREPVAQGHEGGRGRRRLRVLLPGHRRREASRSSAAASSSLAFSDKPEVQAFQTYLSTADWANTSGQARRAAGSPPTRAWTSAT